MLTYAILDTETGGLDEKKEGLASIGILSPSGKLFYTLIKPIPGMEYHPEALKKNGLSLEVLERDGIPEPAALAAARTFLSEECDSSFIAGANVQFDMRFLKESGKRVGGETGDFFERFSHRRTFEVQTQAIVAHDMGLITLPPDIKRPGAVKIDLDSILGSLSLKREGDAHNAMEDCNLTAQALHSIRGKMTDAVSGQGTGEIQMLPSRAMNTDLPDSSRAGLGRIG